MSVGSGCKRMMYTGDKMLLNFGTGYLQVLPGCRCSLSTFFAIPRKSRSVSSCALLYSRILFQSVSTPSATATSSTEMAARQTSKLFYAYLPDANNVLARRYEVRPTHLKRAEEDKKAGILGAYKFFYLTLPSLLRGRYLCRVSACKAQRS